MARVGELRHRVTLQRRTAGSPQQRPSGEPDDAWVTVAEVWAKVAPLAGRELFAAQQVHSEVTGEVEIRYRSDVDAACRVSYGGRSYNILALIDKEERHRFLRLLVAEGANDGT
jgi:SPP1 family predicted phage head-tail adaptor